MLTAERLRELLAYDPETGVFTCLVRRGSGGEVGKTYGVANGTRYVHIRIDIVHAAHRLAWLHFYGEWPKYEIDHIDSRHGNNAIRNLRDVPHNTNMQNRRDANSTNKIGLLGVTRLRSGRYAAQFNRGTGSAHIGTFDTPEEAHSAYLEKKRQHHEGNTL